jgi:Dolichyl-phosphate-mannose-protein mannosyltransferase
VELTIVVGYVRAVSASDRVTRPARRGLRARTVPRNSRRTSAKARGEELGASRIWAARLSAYAWGAIGATTAFIAITCWWLTQDRSIPIYDAGSQLETALIYHGMLQSGNLFGPFTYNAIYPILGHIVGAVSALVGGASVAAPIVGANLVFVPLLALGCYQTGRLLYGPLAGMLAVVFVLGSPLLISLFHVFLLDPPLTALVALSVWLVLASEDFSRRGMSGLAGLAVGLGMNIKVQFALFLVALIVVVLAHGGWRNWRGFAIFTVIALAIGAPWYIVHSSELGSMFELASAGGGTPPGNIPPTLSTDNLMWYFWSVLNSQLLLPLFLLAVTGIGWTLVTVVRSRGKQAARLEFLAGGFGAWLVITFVTPHHDIRYGLPLLGYLAVVGTGWIACVPRKPRLVGIAVLIVGVLSNTLGINFGIGREVKVALTHPLPSTEQGPDQILLYSPNGFLASAPSRDGDVPGLLKALRREGVETVSWVFEHGGPPDFSAAGLSPLARIAGLSPVITQELEFSSLPNTVTLIHEATSARGAPPCTRLSDGTGVWVARYDASVGKTAFYCPTRDPRYYDPGAVG